MSINKWKKISVCEDSNCDERLWHAGLSLDGKKCFVAGFDDNSYIVWDIKHSEVIWKENLNNDNLPILEDWVDENGDILIENGDIKGKYRLFGLFENNPKTFDQEKGLEIKVDLEGYVEVSDSFTNKISEKLKYEKFSGDWAFASFSEDGSIIAVIEPYYVTFFEYQE